jgi:hypothetical protein
MNSIPSSRDASNGPDVKTKFLSLVLFAAAVPTAMFASRCQVVDYRHSLSYRRTENRPAMRVRHRPRRIV